MPRSAPYGVQRGTLCCQFTFLTSTSALEIITDWVGGFRYTIESVKAYDSVLLVGASGTRTLEVIKGASTVVATGAIVQSGTALGRETVLTVTAANATFSDTDKLTVDFATGGTTITAGAINIVITYRQLPQRVSN